MKLIIPIYYDTDEMRRKKELGIEVSLTESIVRDAVFYKILAISSSLEEGRLYAVIDTGGESYMSPLSPKDVVEIIDNYKLRKKNAHS